MRGGLCETEIGASSEENMIGLMKHPDHIVCEYLTKPLSAIRRHVREVHKQRSHHGHAVTRGMFGSRVQVWHQTVSFFDVAPAYRFALRAVHPHLMAPRALGE
jgi:hypothetical protein